MVIKDVRNRLARSRTSTRPSPRRSSIISRRRSSLSMQQPPGLISFAVIPFSFSDFRFVHKRRLGFPGVFDDIAAELGQERFTSSSKERNLGLWFEVYKRTWWRLHKVFH